MQTVQALVFITKAIIETFLYLTGKIEAHKYHQSMDDMKKSITKATTGDLPGRLDGGREVEDQINQHTGGGN
jgi:hypothetical protein